MDEDTATKSSIDKGQTVKLLLSYDQVEGYINERIARLEEAANTMARKKISPCALFWKKMFRKINKKKFMLVAIATVFMACTATTVQAQWIKDLGKKAVERAKEKTKEKVEEKVEQGVDKTVDTVFNKAGQVVTGTGTNKQAARQTATATNNANTAVTTSAQEETAPKTQSVPVVQSQIKLESYSQYDFIPGDQVLLFEDFSQDAVGDFPALWTTDGSGEVKTLNIADGKWLHMVTAGNQYQLMKNLVLPDNYIIEFDAIVPSVEQNSAGLRMTLYKSESADPGFMLSSKDGCEVELDYGYPAWRVNVLHEGGAGWLEGTSEINPIKPDVVEHIIVWVQKRRVRVYHAGKKCIDLPTILPQDFKPNRMIFDTWNLNGSTPYISNIRITTAAPDTRNKLLEEGKLISYGIYFDVNSDKVKPESAGALTDIAKVIKEAGEVKVQIVGHTDNTGDDASNLNLSKRRAAAVKEELVKMGVSALQLSTEGAGETKPIAPNDTPSNKALNRRVEFVKL